MPGEARVVPALLVAVAIWGGSYPAVKAAQAAIPPVPLAAFRCLAAAVVLAGGLAALGRWGPGLRRLAVQEWRALVLLGLAGNTLFQLGMVGGLRYTTPARSAILIALNPVCAALLARAWLGERLGLRRIGGILLALAGVALVVTRAAAGPDPGSLTGDLLSVGAALAWATYSVLGKALLVSHGTLEVTTLAMLIGTAPLLPLGLPGLLRVPWGSLGLGTWALLGYLSVLTLVVAYLLWYWALARAATARVVVFSYLTPVLAAGISVALGFEALTASLVLGAVAVIAGVALTQLG